MITSKSIIYYLVLALWPLIPVIILYFLFQQFNYFGLDDKVRGIVANGPIAAYFALVLLSFTHIRKLFPVNKNIKNLTGQWKAISRSTESGKSYEGIVDVTEKGLNLNFSGSFSDTDTGNLIATIETVTSNIIDNRVHLIYNMTDQQAGNKTFSGYSKLDIQRKDGNITGMEGSWSVIGNNQFGTIIYAKNK